MIANLRYWFLIFLVALVYISGMLVTLFENDSAQFAVMAMRMVQENDFINLFKGPEEYLDKPHMHYWLAALSFKIFGINHWAYRIPGILASFLAAYSCYGLGKLLYNKNVGKLAALVFLTAQTVVLSNIDVRTDAVLTGFTIFAIWQLATYIEKKSFWSIVFGAFGAGMAFSTKGQIALLVIGISLLCHLSYTRKWKVLFSWKVLVAILVFAISVSPMLYAYYLQFDLHPEKIIRGKSGRSGIFFIFWEQSFERLSGEGHGKNSSDYFFFFHTFLWVFLPWTVLALFAYWWRVKAFVKLRFEYNKNFEFLTLGGISIIFIIISFAQFKLPHYLNIVMPLFAILTASYLHSLHRYIKKKEIRALLGVQYAILSIVFICTLLICFYVFKFSEPQGYIILIIALMVVVYFCLKQEADYIRIVTLSVYSCLLLNGVLNMHFYPSLLKYQGGSSMAKVIKENKIPVNKIYKTTNRYTWALDFYNQKPVQISSLQELKTKKDVWVYADDKELEELRNSSIDWNKQYSVDQFRITRLQGKFLKPTERKGVLNKMYLVHLH
ncbi:4-amino-4-deoxy-L-arabinose transferase-like glycosyltransferase [Saonia flava]|uniref:4-amino-4-deoxy-L-arabinose transferase-like glycosyltransferase n=1 Tax=Saonia flava TaxID=523696 RepID=A0A846QTV5_9FLAO|nr:glycosyltransferase family 39 protein [Saonia flava]NJB72396.1 4-amino-4-deoxy-L-arabinose transferase-like glycosyltransferase [Saonia flava]